MQIFNHVPIRNEAITHEAEKGRQTARPQQIQQGDSFSQVLNRQIERQTPLQFSKHASMRLSTRDIALSGEQMKRVEEGVFRAREKGIHDSLVLVDNIALVVNIKSQKVITAMEQGKDSEGIFTNIDGAVIV